jgi:hypothetical protein
MFPAITDRLRQLRALRQDFYQRKYRSPSEYHQLRGVCGSPLAACSDRGAMARLYCAEAIPPSSSWPKIDAMSDISGGQYALFMPTARAIRSCGAIQVFRNRDRPDDGLTVGAGSDGP